MGRSAVAAVLVLAVAVVSCSDSGGATTTTTEPPPVGLASPAAAIESFFALVGGPDGSATPLLVPDRQLVAVVATENSLDATEIAGLLRAGVGDELRDSYWESFGASFEEFSGLSLGELAVLDVTEYAVLDHRFAAVEVGFPTRIGSTYLVASKQEPGGWNVDLVATLAPSLLRPLRSLLTSLPDDEDGDVVRALFTQLVPSFLAAAESPVDDQVAEDVRREIEALVRFVSPGLS